MTTSIILSFLKRKFLIPFLLLTNLINLHNTITKTTLENQFANIGSGFQDLMFRVNKEQNLALLPTRKSHFILGIDDVKYYDVKTPTTSFIYHNAMKQGAALKTTYTQNVGKIST